MVVFNSGLGLGLLLVFILFGKGMSKCFVFGVMIIYFFGGIYELYFLYVLMKLLIIIVMIVGGMFGIWMFNLLDGGLVVGLSLGFIFVYLVLMLKGLFLVIIVGVMVGILVFFVIILLILKMEKMVEMESEDEFV